MPSQEAAAGATLSNCRDLPFEAAGTVHSLKGGFDTKVKAVGMVIIQQIGTIGSQGLREKSYDCSSQTRWQWVRHLPGLRYSRSPPKGGDREDVLEIFRTESPIESILSSSMGDCVNGRPTLSASLSTGFNASSWFPPKFPPG